MEQRIERGKRPFHKRKLYGSHSAFVHISMETSENSKDTVRVRCEYTKSSVLVMVTRGVADGIMCVDERSAIFYSSHDYVINITRPIWY